MYSSSARHRRCAHGQEPRLAELSATDGQHSRLDVEVADVEAMSLADANAGRVEKAEQRRCGGRPQAACRRPCTSGSRPIHQISSSSNDRLELGWHDDPGSTTTKRSGGCEWSGGELDGSTVPLRVRQCSPDNAHSVLATTCEQRSDRLEIVDEDCRRRGFRCRGPTKRSNLANSRSCESKAAPPARFSCTNRRKYGASQLENRITTAPPATPRQLPGDADDPLLRRS